MIVIREHHKRHPFSSNYHIGIHREQGDFALFLVGYDNISEVTYHFYPTFSNIIDNFLRSNIVLSRFELLGIGTQAENVA